MSTDAKSSKELALRIQTALIWGGITLFALLYHADSFSMLLIIASIICLREWRTLNARRSLIFSLTTGIYTFIAMGSLAWLRNAHLPMMIFNGSSYVYVLALFITVWSADTAGYAFGKLIGGPKCWPRISPGKTWSGTIAALIAGPLAFTCFALEFTGIQSVQFAVILGFITTVAAISGDALESYLKRRADVKDSGTLLPGHGGLLDRIDALMLAAPVFSSGIYLHFFMWA